jgi:hypothetical protein
VVNFVLGKNGALFGVIIFDQIKLVFAELGRGKRKMTDQAMLDELMFWLLGLRELPEAERDELVASLRTWLALH